MLYQLSYTLHATSPYNGPGTKSSPGGTDSNHSSFSRIGLEPVFQRGAGIARKPASQAQLVIIRHLIDRALWPGLNGCTQNGEPQSSPSP